MALLAGVITDGVVRLRPIVRSDGPAMLRYIAGDDEIARWTRIPSPYTKAQCDSFLDLVDGYNDATTDLVTAVCVGDDDELVGSVGLHRIGVAVDPTSSFLSEELGYWLAAKHRGSGIMTRCARLLTHYSLANLALPKVHLQTVAGNVASQGVALAVGYRYLGLVRGTELSDDTHDSERYEMTRDDFIAANGAMRPLDVTPI